MAVKKGHRSYYGKNIDGIDPVPDTKGFKQGRYSRGAHAAQAAPRLTWHKSCIRMAMAGKTYANRGEVKKALIKHSKECAAKNPEKRRRRGRGRSEEFSSESD